MSYIHPGAQMTVQKYQTLLFPIAHFNVLNNFKIWDIGGGGWLLSGIFFLASDWEKCES